MRGRERKEGGTREREAEDRKLDLRDTFQVRYAPKVSLSKIDHIIEGSELRFRCHAEANPPNVEYR